MDKEGLRESYKLYGYIQETQFKMKFPALLVETCIGLNGLTLAPLTLTKKPQAEKMLKSNICVLGVIACACCLE